MWRAAGTLVVITALVGCRNQSSTTFTNPFLSPDRVPPPSTRVLAPGTAAPYYPGDPLPGAVPGALPGAAPVGAPQPTYPPGGTLPPGGAYPPGTSFSPGAVGPGTAYPAGPAYPVGPTSPTGPITPPGGWGTYPPQSQAAPSPGGTAAPSGGLQTPAQLAWGRFGVSPTVSGDQRVQAPTDQQPLRLASTASQSTMNVSAGAPSAGGFLPNAGAQSSAAQAAFQQTAGGPGAPGRLQIREVAPAEYQQIGQPAAAEASPQAAATRDGFRPQGSQPRIDSSPAQSFRPPEIRRDSVAANSNAAAPAAAAKYAVGENYQWVRGQLEYWPDSGQWTVRYLEVGQPADQLGGRVHIENPQVLANLPPGEFVMVRGQLYSQQSEDDESPQPIYRLAAVERQRQ